MGLTETVVGVGTPEVGLAGLGRFGFTPHGSVHHEMVETRQIVVVPLEQSGRALLHHQVPHHVQPAVQQDGDRK